MRKNTRRGLGGASVLLAVALGAYYVVDPFSEPSKPAPLSGEEVSVAAKSFLDAWAEGDFPAAVEATSDAEAATNALRDFRERARVARVSYGAVRRAGTTVAFSLRALIRADGGEVPWRYQSSLKVVRNQSSGEPQVEWDPSVIHPRLGQGDVLETARAQKPELQALDRDGKALNPEDFPSLAGILAALDERYGRLVAGTPGFQVQIRESGNRAVTPLHPVTPGKPGKIRTTLSVSLQRAAEKAAKKHPESSAVAIQPSSGHILAVANHRKDGFNAAFLGKLAPGSTMKIITAAMLLEKRLVAETGKVPCPKFSTFEGATFHNVNKFDIPEGSFSDGFIQSCNTTFIEFADDVAADDLTKESQEVFGIGLNWRSGVSTFDGAVPVAEGSESAAAMIGQGRVQMNPLNMASVVATASTGTFRQPVLVPPELDGRAIVRSQRTLPRVVARQLRSMLARTATEGTAADAMRGLPGDVGAKTGSAEVGGSDVADSWFTAYRGDVAAAAVVQRGGHGGDAAGPLVREILQAGG
ncbi:penicillin-binding protein [Streptomyces luteolifulvus]|uniref:Penicillin-binding protein n=1 Tax=Streptomyces luteolifulvus TaxID=2615112 RepID=A0A6H9USV9_9ACTN|nr:penicillin-binding protein [Streptomyces luteolifulvus]